MSSHCHPDAVDGVDHAGHDAERQNVPHALPGDISLAAEHPAPLNEVVNYLANDHGNHIGSEVGDTALVCTVADTVQPQLGVCRRLY